MSEGSRQYLWEVRDDDDHTVVAVLSDGTVLVKGCEASVEEAEAWLREIFEGVTLNSVLASFHAVIPTKH